MKCCTKECSFYHSFYWIISNWTIIIHPGPRYRWQTRSFSSLTTSFLSRPRPMLSSEASLSWTECSDPESVWLSGPTILDDIVRWFHKTCSAHPKLKWLRAIYLAGFSYHCSRCCVQTPPQSPHWFPSSSSRHVCHVCHECSSGQPHSSVGRSPLKQ